MSRRTASISLLHAACALSPKARHGIFSADAVARIRRKALLPDAVVSGSAWRRRHTRTSRTADALFSGRGAPVLVLPCTRRCSLATHGLVDGALPRRLRPGATRRFVGFPGRERHRMGDAMVGVFERYLVGEPLPQEFAEVRVAEATRAAAFFHFR